MSNQVGRNDPCPCGSGKKYKKCCGVKDAIPITVLLERDAVALHSQIIDYAVSEFSGELGKDFKEKLEYLVIKDQQKELQFYVLAHTVWFTFFGDLGDGTTIFERFMKEKGDTILRPKLREIAETWTNARPVAGPVLSVSGERLQIRDVLTDEVLDIKLLSPVKTSEQAYGIAIVIPFGEDKIFFWEPFDYKSPLKGNEEKYLKNEFAASPFDDPVKFLAKDFLIIMNQLPLFAVKYGAEDIQWEKPAHKETAGLLEKGLASYDNAYEATITAFALWNSYCKKNPDQRRKPATYAAAIHYLLLNMNPKTKMTKKDAAELYNISASALSAALNDIEESIADEIEQFATAMSEDMAAAAQAAPAKEEK